GQRVDAIADSLGYVSLDRRWKNADAIEVVFPIANRIVVADERVRANRRRVAIERGPIVYCLESKDAAAGRALDVQLDPRGSLQAAKDDERFSGVTVLHTDATRITAPSSPRQPVKLIPYHLWANRGAAEMTVWLSTSGYALGDVGPAGGFIFYENPRFE